METIINSNIKVQNVLIFDERCIFVAHEDGRGYVLTNNPTLNGNRSESLMALYPEYKYSWQDEGYNQLLHEYTFIWPEFFDGSIQILASEKSRIRTEIHLERLCLTTIKQLIDFRKESKEFYDKFMDEIVKCRYTGVYLRKAEAIAVYDGYAHSDIAHELLKCSHCSVLYHPDHDEHHDEVDLCPSCTPDFCKCDCCEEWFHKDELEETNGGEMVCSSCLDMNYFRCEDCHRWHHNDDLVTVNRGDRNICESCRDYGDYSYCDGCGNWFHYDYMDGEYCNDCKPSLNLDSYGEKFSIHEDFGQKRMYGIEIEVGGNEINKCIDAVSDVRDEYDNKIVMCKEDGSLENTGFEMVTYPMIRDKAIETAVNLCRIVRKNGVTADRSCGVHVHVSRASLRKSTIAKLLMLFSENESDIERIARRDIEEWARIIKKDRVDNLSDAYDMVEYHREEGRYQAINTCNSSTIEFRIFKGTTQEKFIKSYILFVDAVIATAEKIRLKHTYEKTLVENMEAAGVLKEKKYQHLVEYLKEVKVL